jgi:hypothetical protein
MANGDMSSSLFRTIGMLWRTLAKDIADPYRPELHYMRGPGPKWHAKHAAATAEAPRMAGLARAEG